MPKSTRSNTSLTIQSQSSNVEKIQAETEKYTQKYEWQKRNLLTIQNVINSLTKQLHDTNNSIGKLKKECEEGEMKLIFTKMRNLHKQIDICDKRCNDILGDIEAGKTQINQLRSQRLSLLKNEKMIEGDLLKAQQEKQKIYQQIKNDKNISNSNLNVMIDLKIKNESQKDSYYKQLRQLNNKIRDLKFNGSDVNDLNQSSAYADDTASILKNRLTKMILNNKEKVKLIDQYQKNMKLIDQAFNTIKEATGVTDIDEIQNTFIKSEQQSYGLLTYVDILNQQTDNLIDCNQQLSKKIEKSKRENQQRDRILNGTPDEEKRRRKIEQIVKGNQQNINKFRNLVGKLQPGFQRLIKSLTRTNLNKQNGQIAEFSGNTLSESSLNEYLAKFEQYTNQIIIYKLKLNKETDSQIISKTLLLEELPAKSFIKKSIENQLINNTEEENTKQLMDINKLVVSANRQIQKYRNAVNERQKKK